MFRCYNMRTLYPRRLFKTEKRIHTKAFYTVLPLKMLLKNNFFVQVIHYDYQTLKSLKRISSYRFFVFYSKFLLFLHRFDGQWADFGKFINVVFSLYFLKNVDRPRKSVSRTRPPANRKRAVTAYTNYYSFRFVSAGGQRDRFIMGGGCRDVLILRC